MEGGAAKPPRRRASFNDPTSSLASLYHYAKALRVLQRVIFIDDELSGYNYSPTITRFPVASHLATIGVNRTLVMLDF